MPLPPLVQAMLEPSFYPHHPAEVELRQTHISYVFLAGDEVFKVKKPVRFTFLDFSTAERRRHFCHEEVRLNRRLAEGIYLGVVGLRADGGGFRLTTEDDPAAVEVAVRMRRLPDERTLENLLTRDPGVIGSAEMDRLAARLAMFHDGADASEEVTANGAPAAILSVLEDNYAGVAPFRGDTISVEEDDDIQGFARGFLAANADLLARRRAEHRIREGHGDLRNDHVYLVDPLVIVDCVEFSPRYRWCDVASDLAFLVMDLDRHGRRDLSTRLVSRYAAVTGDTELRRLLPFYCCYRAYVRGKVESLKSAEEEVGAEERKAARDSARAYFALARRYAWAERPALVVVAGLSGTGKSSLARVIAERTGFSLLSTDEIRKELAGLAPTERAQGETRDDLYSAVMSRRTYDEILTRAAQALHTGSGVVLDGTFQLREGRERALRIAAAATVPLLMIETRCSDDEVRRRLARRARRGDDPSDADWAVYREQRSRFEPFGPDEKVLSLDTSAGIEALWPEVEGALHRAERRE